MVIVFGEGEKDLEVIGTSIRSPAIGRVDHEEGGSACGLSIIGWRC